MAAIFQIRRGTADVTLADGELYLHKNVGTLQISSGSDTPLNLLPLDKQIEGNIILQGNITASNAFFTGDVAISGNLYLGNNQSDNINALGVFTSDLRPAESNIYALGTDASVWSRVYANSVSASAITGSFFGNINASNNVVSGAIQVLGGSTVISSSNITFAEFSSSIYTATASLNLATQSIYEATASLNLATQSIYQSTASLNAATQSIYQSTASLNAYSASSSQSVHLINIATASVLYTSSFLTYSQSVAQESSSFNTFFFTPSNGFSASVNSFLLDLDASTSLLSTKTYQLELKSASYDRSISAINSYTSSLQQAISASGQNLIVYGNLTVQGTQTSLNTDQLYVEDLAITIASGATTPAAANGAGIYIDGAGVSMSWDNGSNVFRINKPLHITGEISASTINGLGGDTVYNFSQSVAGLLSDLDASTSLLSVKTYQLELKSASYDNSIRLINSVTSSVNAYTQSADNKFDLISQSTASINTFTSSQELKDETLKTYTSSLNTQIARLIESTASLNTYSASASQSVFLINAATKSLYDSTASLNAVTKSLYEATASLNSYSASASQSVFWLNSFSSSATASITNLNAHSASVSASLINLVAHSQSVSTSIFYINDFTESFYLDFSGSDYSTFKNYATDKLIDLEGRIDYLDPNTQAEAFGDLTSTASYLDARFINDTIVSRSTNTDSIRLTISGKSISGIAVGGILSSSVTTFSQYTQSVISELDKIRNVTGSYATTGSNIFVANQIVSASFDISGSFTASLAEGYAWVGSPDGRARAVETASFASLIPAGVLSSSNTTFADFTASVNSHTESVDLALTNIIEATGSYAITGSNTFYGDQTIYGDLFISSSSPDALHISGSITSQIDAFNRFEISQYNSDNVIYISSSQDATKNIAFRNNNDGTAAGFGAYFYNNLNDFLQLVQTSENNTVFTGSVSVLRSTAGNGFRIQTDGGPISFLPQNGGTAGANKNREIARITSVGLGVGTNEPQFILDVSGGAVRFDDELIVTGSFTASLSEGNIWVGDANNKTVLIQTSSLIAALPEGTLSSSVISFASYTQSVEDTLNTLINVTSSYSTTGSNSFEGNQSINGDLIISGSTTISGSTYILGDLVIYGSSSIQTITGSILDIETNKIILNSATPAVRWAGISVYDEGSTNGTGSLYYDSINNAWLVQQPYDVSNTKTAFLLNAQPNYGSIGDEQGLRSGSILLSLGSTDVSSSQISDDGRTISIINNLVVTGSFTSSLAEGYMVVGGTNNITTTIPTASLTPSSNYTVSVIDTNTNASASIVYVLNSSLTLTLPNAPASGSWIKISNLSNTATCTLGRNGKKIMALSEDMILDDPQASFELIWTGDTNGWVIIGTR